MPKYGVNSYHLGYVYIQILGQNTRRLAGRKLSDTFLVG